MIRDAQSAEFDNARFWFAEHQDGRNILSLPSCGPIERSLDFLVVRGVVVWVVGFRITPVAAVASVDGECVLPRVLVLGDAAIIRDEHYCRWCIRPICAEITDPTDVFDAAIERTANLP